MLTTFCWVPKGAMKPIPIHSTDSVETVREKLKKQNPDYIEDEVASAAEHVLRDDGDAEDSDAEEDDDMFNRFGGGDTILEQVESDDDEEIDDTHFKETDSVFISARADPKDPKLEVYVYDEPEDSLYVHHDMTVSAFPLCSTWMSDGTMSLVALGTMLPFLEIWPLDVIDAVEPACLLGGCVQSADNYRRKIKKDKLKPDSHQEAVLCTQWNTMVQHILVSGSADKTVKLWDLNTQDCVGTYHEPEKVQSLDWHRQEANLLLSGSFCGSLVIRDCRRPDDAAIRWNLPSIVEHVEFASAGNLVFASLSNGAFCGFETRMNSEPLWTIQAHDEETTFAVSRHLPGLIATGGKDGYLTLWDSRNAAQEPLKVVSRKYKTGSVLSIAFHPNAPHLLGACGSRGQALVYTMTADLQGVFS